MKKILIVFFTSIAYFFASTLVLASGQYGQYGSPSYVSSLLIDKLVVNPATGEYVDNLSVSDNKFAPLSYVYFKLTVKNTGNVDIAGVKVIDYLPSYLEYADDKGEYDASTRQLKIEMGDFRVDETKSVIFKARVVSANNLPAEKSVLCLINRAVVVFDNQEKDLDTAQFCVEKTAAAPAKETKEMPKAGTSIPVFALMSLAFGYIVKKQLSV
ncbi:MAG: hypothetical protein KatS3mg091_105 [Patescibacteria group bacterium]|nr:MAG: hypothetical protein KatS3mg091_105 [Patescibacteria group bacterium]